MGNQLYTLAGLGPVASIIANLSAYVMTMILASSVKMAMCGMVINQIFLPMIPAPILSAGYCEENIPICLAAIKADPLRNTPASMYHW
ncbi:MAG: hypothetical protein KBG63_05835 [Acetobacterium sp.]|nr:hypothetical protein [Acetobacterium sp.]